MNKKSYLIPLLVILIIAGVIIYVLQGISSTQLQSENQARDIKIGMIAGTTGEFAVVGENFVNGANIALDEWNRNNPDRQVSLITEDDGFDPVKGIAAFRKLTSLDDVDALVNMTSVTIDAVYSDVVNGGIPLVQLGEQGINPENDNVFQVLEGNVATAIALGEKVKEEGKSNVVVFVSNNATYERFYEGFVTGYSNQHTIIRINPGDTSTIRTEIIRAASLNPDAIVIMTVPGDGAVVADEVKLRSPEVALYLDGSALTGWSEYQKILGDTNVLNGDSIVVLRQSELSGNFVSEYQSRYQTDPQVGSAWGYDAVTFLLSTMPEDSRDWSTWTANMSNMTVMGAGNEIVYDEVGVRLPDFFIGNIQRGELPKN
jgi:branched-chain amino acid transport system substrate-binding protein